MQATPLPIGYTGAYIGAMSDDGSIVVGQTGNDTIREAFRWSTSSATMTTGSVPGQINAVANVISGDGSRIYGHTDYVVFEWRLNQAPSQMLNLPAGTALNACSTNGVIVAGWLPGVNSDPSRSLIYNASDGTISTPTATTHSEGFYGISGDGTVAVGFDVSSDQPTRWTSAGFNYLPATSPSMAIAISPNGQYAVGNVGTEAALWSGTELQTLTRLGKMATLPDWRAEGRDVNQDGTVVVGRALPPRGGTNIALLWTPAGGLQRLSDALAAAGIDVSDWEQLQEVAAVSPSGKIIAGTGVKKGGVQLGFVARLP
jgi:uncharacterized membrane protein